MSTSNPPNATGPGPNVRILTKGGVWKNTEDEILKASVMKYGKNEWARISSLLVRKTPKQCKARWFEWLDPSIKKTDWSIQEDEKLLHLAKLMPTQWRTIGPIVGRTAAQCLDRYQQLLDEAEAKNEGEGMNSDDIRKLKPGEVDPNPETKPARPDPVDMDEDEKEMLSEARARLSNTQGKKAKRKARAKTLEDSRRLSVLQKKRELKAAGITMNMSQRRKKMGGMNYNKDIPFHAPAPAGFWNTLEEKEREAEIKPVSGPVSIEKLEGGKKRSVIENEERKKDVKRLKQRKNDGEYVSAQALKAMKEAENLTSNRKSMSLPAPQVSDGELEAIVKIGQSGQFANSIVGADTASKALLTDYSAINSGAPMRTPRVESNSTDSVQSRARDLHAIMSSQTPLLGEDVNVEGDEMFVNASGRAIASTPNPVASHITPRGPKDALSSRPSQTPQRDQMGINTPRSFSSEISRKSNLQLLFAKLPKPTNDFEIVVPQTQDYLEPSLSFIPDQLDVLADKEAERIRQHQFQQSMRSRVVVLDLPRPLVVRSSCFSTQGKCPSMTLLLPEMHALIRRDAILYPVPGQVIPSGGVEGFEYIEKARLDEAHELIKRETDKVDINAFCAMREMLEKKYIYIPGQDGSLGRFKELSKVGKEEHLAILQTKTDANRQKLREESIKAAALESKITSDIEPFVEKAKDLRREFDEVWDEIEHLDRQKIGVEHLLSNFENAACIERVEAAKRELEHLQRLEQESQCEYKELLAGNR